MTSQVSHFLRTLAPQPKHAVRLAISQLAQGDAGNKALRERLAAYHRIAVGKHRVIYLSRPESAICVFAGPRKTIYEEFKPAN